MEEICRDIGLKLVKPLFGINRKQQIRYLLKHNFSAIITSASKWFKPDWIGILLDSDCVGALGYG
ncbi:MAG: hypothetical protein ACQXXL_07735 [Candidatus Methanosuratincola sp.]|jgi:diphthamide synthase (EF-2-diphthine--ammonia ligase)